MIAVSAAPVCAVSDAHSRPLTTTSNGTAGCIGGTIMPR